MLWPWLQTLSSTYCLKATSSATDWAFDLRVKEGSVEQSDKTWRMGNNAMTLKEQLRDRQRKMMAGRTEKEEGRSTQRQEVLGYCFLWNSKGHVAIWIRSLGDMQGHVSLHRLRSEVTSFFNVITASLPLFWVALFSAFVHFPAKMGTYWFWHPQMFVFWLGNTYVVLNN